MNYNASSIQVLKGLEPVQKRPGMYTDTRNPNHLAMEVIDNSLDEALAGHASDIVVELHADGSISVSDNGRGMPTDMHPEHHKTGVELIMTQLHSGAKFSQDTYRFSGGLHGVGVSVVNALSAWLNVEVMQHGRKYRARFEDGVMTMPLEVISEVAKKKTGTYIHFYPRSVYFEHGSFDVDGLKKLLKSKSILCQDVAITWRHEDETIRWHYPDGLVGYLTELISTVQPLFSEVVHGSDLSAHQGAEWGMIWLTEGGSCQSYVNLVPTPLGGNHVMGLRQGMLDAVRNYIERYMALPKNVKLKAEDVCDHVWIIFSYKTQDPIFAGQTKERLAMPSCQSYVTQLIHDRLTVWLHQNRPYADLIAQASIQAAQLRLRSQDKVQRKSVTSGLALPGKLSDCVSRDRSNSELFLVEGDSAGGSCKQARDRTFQAVLPLRGKILNTWEVDHKELLASQEVRDISTAIGVSPGSTDLSTLRYGRICLLADADSDGAHISTLLCALFVRHFPTLVQKGHVYVAMPPLYRIDSGKNIFYVRNDAERDRCIAKLGSKSFSIQRFKGLGEMNPGQLRETTMDPSQRMLLQLVWPNNESIEKGMNLLLGKKEAKMRRVWLENFVTDVQIDEVD